MKEHIIQEINQRINYLTKNRDTLVADGDTHPSDPNEYPAAVQSRLAATKNYYQGRPISADDLVKEMDLAGVDVCIAWQNPAVMFYHEVCDRNYKLNYEKLLKANKYIYDSARKYPTRIIPCGWTDPKALGVELALKLSYICINEYGFPIVKMNPAQNSYMLDSPEIKVITNYIIEMGAIPAIHYGGDTKYTPPKALEKLASANPQHPIIAVHMGGGGSHYVYGDDQYIKSRKLGLEHPNIFFILSAKRDCHIESDLITYQLAGEPFCSNLACGSDAPYGKMTWNYGGFKAMFTALKNSKDHTDQRVIENPGLFTDDVIQNYMGRNLLNLIIKGYQRILELQMNHHSDKH